MSIDSAHCFGDEQNLAAVVSRPEAGGGAAEASTYGVLFLNAGIEHRVGPRGLYTALARGLVELGAAVIRFDYSGLGESRKPLNSTAAAYTGESSAQVTLECRQAMDLLTSEAGCSRFVVMGLCSGADDAHRLALADDRIVGVITLDGYGYPTWRFHLNYYLQRIFSPRRWVNLWRRLRATSARSTESTDALPTGGGNGGEAFDFVVMPDRDRLAREMKTLVERGVSVLAVFSGEARDYYNYPSQLRDALADVPWDRQLTERFMPSADHTFSRNTERDALLKHIGNWLAALR